MLGSRTLRSILAIAAMSAAAKAVHATGYVVHPLVSDQPGVAPITDPDLVNPWGISIGPTTPFWAANNGTGTSTLYSVTGSALNVSKVGLIVSMPGSAPITGTVFNGSNTDFTVTSGAASGAARFLFASEDGGIFGWNSAVPAAGSTAAQVGATDPTAIYKGLTLANNGSANFLYAANFTSSTPSVFTNTFAPATLGGATANASTLTGTFTDPNVPAGYNVFNVQLLNNKIYVSYAQKDPSSDDELAGPGKGYVSVFDTNGNLQQHLISGGHLNAPWGMALAPASFGDFGGDLLVGNFGDGTINAFDPATGSYVGTLSDASNNIISVNGLWAITFGNGVSGGRTDTLYFTAGIADESHGLFGAITVPEPATISFLGFALLLGVRRRRESI